MRGQCVGAIPAPMVMPWSLRICLADWETPPWGQVTTSAATGPLPVGPGVNLVNFPAGLPAYIESVANGLHYGPWQSANWTPGPTRYTVRAAYAGRQWIEVSYAGAAGSFFDVQNGVIGTVPPGHTATMTAVGGGYYDCADDFPLAPTNDLYVVLSVAGVRGAYLGDGVSGVLIPQVTVRQIRASGIVDVQPARTYPAPKTVPYNRSQGAIGVQPFYQFNATTGLWEIWSPDNSVRYCTNSLAEFMGILSGINKPFTVQMAYRLEATAPTSAWPFRISSIAGYQFHRNSAQRPQCLRFDGITTKAIGPVGVATTNMVLDTWAFDGSNGYLYRNGALLAGPVNQALAFNFVATGLYSVLNKSGEVSCVLWNGALSGPEIRAQAWAAMRKRRIAA